MHQTNCLGWVLVTALFLTGGMSGTYAQSSDPPPSTSSEAPTESSDSPKLVWEERIGESGKPIMVLVPAGSSSDEPEVAGGDVSQFVSPNPQTDLGRPEASDSGDEPWYNTPPNVPKMTSFGVYGGFPSAVGIQVVVPTDATLAFRTGLTGFPGVGWLLTPGAEIRFGQTPGTYNVNSSYLFSNLFFGQTTKGSPNEDHWGMEAGLGYRWILPDRRAVRWIAAVEIGAQWRPDSAWPEQPSVRAFWMIASP